MGVDRLAPFLEVVQANSRETRDNNRQQKEVSRTGNGQKVDATVASVALAFAPSQRF